MGESNWRMDRREFLKRSARNTGFLALGAIAMMGAKTSARAADGKGANPFAYDISNWEKTDPAQVRYQEMGRFRIGSPEPRRICIGSGGVLCVATRRGVSILNNEGTVLLDLPASAPVRCVTVAAEGTLYAGLRDHIEVFNAKGEHVATWDSPSKRTWLTGLAVSEKDLFAADSASRCVIRYDRSGKPLGRIGERNKDRNVAGLIVPSPYLDVEMGRDGLLRVNNPGRHRVELYTPEGDFEGCWGKPSASIEGFCGCCNPVALARLPDGKWATCEKGLPRVKVYSADGNFECVVAGPESFSENGKAGSVHDFSDGTMGGLDAAVDAEGKIYILDLVSRDVRVMRTKT